MTTRRRDPDQLLKNVQEEEKKEDRGKLKIYLGAAPGVGKTHAMLNDAREELKKGLDIVIGVAESHGREEIDALLEGFEILPKQTVHYHGKELVEFDLDGALKRHPALILMDEMAHTNAPGLRHNKRWQDIKELLDRGIDVSTTLNVQHIESLSGDVSQIIHSAIHETVPDSMLELADTIELIDIPPNELLERLHEGKVYFPAQADLAAESFFRKGNLIALRELALRVTAERVNAEVLLYRQGQGIQTIWATKEKFLVCVGPRPESQRLIRAAKRIATSLQADWIAVYIDTNSIKDSADARARAIKNLQLAERLGGETRILMGTDIVKEVMAYAREQNVTQIMIWKHVRNRWHDIFSRNLVDEIVRNSGEINVYIMTGTLEEKAEKPLSKRGHKIPWKAYFISVLAVTLATTVNYLIFTDLHSSNLIMVYLLAVTLVAMMGRMGPSIVASVLSVIAYDFFFVAPLYQFSISSVHVIFSLVVMLFVAQVISQLTILTRRQTESARNLERQTSALYTLSRQLVSARGADKLLAIGANYLADLFDCQVLALLPVKNELVIRARARTIKDLDEKEMGVAQWVYELGQKAGLGTDSLSFSDSLFIPLLGSSGVVGVLSLKPADHEAFFTPERSHLLDACANQIALALEVDHLYEQKHQSKMRTEADRARNTLLKAVTHDLRTPLLAIIGAASTQAEMSKTLTPQEIEKLGKGITKEAEELRHLLDNLMQISYLEAEKVVLHRRPLSLSDVIQLVLESAHERLSKRPVHLDIPERLPLIPFDNTLIQGVIYNLLDNVLKFTPPKSPIEITVILEPSFAQVSMRDHGPGIMLDEVNKLFEKFYRGRMLKEQHGLGLGLAISRSIIIAHHGRMWAENAEGGGAVFYFTLPLS